MAKRNSDKEEMEVEELREVNFLKEINLDNYAVKHSDAVASINDFKAKIRGKKDWENAKDIVAFFGASKVRTIGSDRLRFEIAGNNHRMVVKYLFGKKSICFFLRWIGTKGASEKVDLENESNC